MKKLIVACAAVAVFCCAPAHASDMPMKGPVYKATPAPMFNWTGFYVGGNIGYGWAHQDPGVISFFQPIGVFAGSIPGINANQHGVIGGPQAGYNQQFGNMVLGVEGDISWTGIKGSVTDPINAYTATSKINWLATGRGRAGVAFDRTLVYATGGVAVGRVDIRLDDTYPVGVITTTSATTHVGWTVGAGVETAISPNLTLKAEYLYVDLGSKQQNHFEPSPPGWPQISYNSAVTANIVRVGLNYMFASGKY